MADKNNPVTHSIISDIVNCSKTFSRHRISETFLKYVMECHIIALNRIENHE